MVATQLSPDPDGVSFTKLGIYFGGDIVVYKIMPSPCGGLSRIELGRSRYMNAARPNFFFAGAATSPRYIFIPEVPMHIDLPSVMGLSRYDSDYEDDTDTVNFFIFRWREEVRTDRAAEHPY